jgi:hypothetical protein
MFHGLHVNKLRFNENSMQSHLSLHEGSEIWLSEQAVGMGLAKTQIQFMFTFAI